MSKVRTVLSAAVLVIAAAVVSPIAVSKWNLFPSKDYEDCAARAAKDAKSKDGLALLLSICSTDFEGRRKPGGGYTYYDACQHRKFDIRGPNRSPDEVKYIKTECLAHLDAEERVAAEQAEAERKAQRAAQEASERRQRAAAEAWARQTRAAEEARARELLAAEEARRAIELKKDSVIRAIRAALTNFECQQFNYDPPGHFDAEGHWVDGVQTCKEEWPWIDMKIKVTNGSKDAVSRVILGLAMVPTTSATCPSSYAEKRTLNINLSPGETRETKIDNVDHAFKRNRFCLKALDVQFAER
jgi:hypothetical protein